MPAAMDMLVLPLLAAALLVFFSVLAGLFSARAGFSFLLVFLLAGILAGEDGPGGIVFDDVNLSFWVGNVALAVILLDGGLRTDFATFRTGLKPALLLASVGVVMSAALTAFGAWWLMGLDWRLAMLLGSIVGSTDAAAVFALLRSSGVRLNERVAATLEIESGMNDPMAVYLTIAFIGIALAGTGGTAADGGALGPWGEAIKALVQQFGLGGVIGGVAGVALAALLKRSFPRFAAQQQGAASGGGILALLCVSMGLAVFAATSWVGGSGFLAVYVMGVTARARAREAVAPALSALDGYAWLSQAAMFLLLGLLLTPHQLLPGLAPALGVAAFLLLVARPLTVWLCLLPFHFEPREVLYISWVGLRGAVPIVLAVFPLMAGVPGARTLFNAAFVVVLTSLILQGSTIALAARKLGLNLPEADDDSARRLVFGDFALEGRTPVADVCAFYGLPEPPNADWPLERWIGHALHRPPVVGDHVQLGSAELSVRAMEGARVLIVGLRLPARVDADDGA